MWGLEESLKDGIRHVLYARALVSQLDLEHTHHKRICHWGRVGFKARQGLLALSMFGGSVVKYQKALMERWPTDLGAEILAT